MSTSRSPLIERHKPATTLPTTESETAPIDRLRSLAQTQRFRRRQRQTLAGQSGYLIVRSGVLTINSGGGPGNASIVEILYPGDVMAPSDVAPLPDLSLTASQAAECWRITTQAFATEVARDGALARIVIERQSARHARLQLHVAILAELTSEQRAVALLIEAAARLGSGQSSDGVVFEMPWSRVEVAEYLALNADTLSRITSRLTQKGIIARLSRSQLAVRKWSELLALCPLAATIVALHKPDRPAS